MDTDFPGRNNAPPGDDAVSYTVGIADQVEDRFRLALGAQGLMVAWSLEFGWPSRATFETSERLKEHGLVRQWRANLPPMLPKLSWKPRPLGSLDDGTEDHKPHILHPVPCREPELSHMDLLESPRAGPPAGLYLGGGGYRPKVRLASRSQIRGPASALRGGASRRPEPRRSASMRATFRDPVVKQELSPSGSPDRRAWRSESAHSERPGINRRSPRGSASPFRQAERPRESSRSRDRSQSRSRLGAVPLHVRGDVAAPVHGVERPPEETAQLRVRAAQSVAQREAAGDRGYVLPNRGFPPEALRMEHCPRDGHSHIICHLYNGWGCPNEGKNVEDKRGKWHQCPMGCCLTTSGNPKAHGCIRCGGWGHSHTHCDMHKSRLPPAQVQTEEDRRRVMSGVRSSHHRDEYGDLPPGHRESMRDLYKDVKTEPLWEC